MEWLDGESLADRIARGPLGVAEAEILGRQVAEALAEARVAIETAPERMQGHLTLAQILAKAKQIPQARMEYQEAIRLAEAGGADYYRGQIYNVRRGLAALDSVR